MEVEKIDGIKFPNVGPRTAWLLRGDPNASAWVKESGRIDHDRATLLRTAALRGADGVIWDVGAYLGTHACAYACMAKEVYAFEARRDAADCLRENLRHYKNARGFLGVIGDGTHGAPEPTTEVNGGARRVRIEPNASPSFMLDQLVTDGRVAAPTLVKMDIEGWEVKALRGMEEVLERVRPTLILEVQREALKAAGDSVQALVALLQARDYFAATIDGKVWDPADGCPQRDIVAWPYERGVLWQGERR
jgi:FkbM family methyltransferase